MPKTTVPQPLLSESEVEQLIADMQGKLDTCAQSGVAYRVKWHDIKVLITTLQSLRDQMAFEKKWHDDHAEREAAVCPEDVPCDEYIRSLEKQNAALHEQLAEAHTNVESLTRTIFRSEQATRMRDLCVEKIRQIAADYDNLRHPNTGAAISKQALLYAARQIESLTLEQEQKQHG